MSGYGESSVPIGQNISIIKTFGPFSTTLANCHWTYLSYIGTTTLSAGSYTYDDGIVVTTATTSPYLFDNVTNDNTPSFSGTVGPTATRVDLYDGATLVGSDAAPVTGTWHLTATPLLDGAHTLSATASNAGGASAPGPSLQITIDSLAPVAPSAPDMTPASDTGTSNSDNITDQLQPSFTGAGSPDTRTVGLQDGGRRVGMDNAPAAGTTYAITTIPHLGAGRRTFTAVAYDLAGNASVASVGLPAEIVVALRHLAANVAPDTYVGATTMVAASVLTEASQPVATWSGTIRVATDDIGAAFPDGTTYAIAAGSFETGHLFRVLFSTAGSHSITVSSAGIPSATVNVEVAATSLYLTAPATVYQNAPFTLTTKVRGTVSNLPVPAYSALATYTSSDSTAVFNGAMAGNRYQFTCGCLDGKQFAMTLGTLGSQTITITDQFFITYTTTVNVVLGSSGAPNPVISLQTVQWHHGNTVDYYVKIAPNTPPLHFVAANDYCQATGASFWSQESMNVSVQATGSSAQYAEFSVKVGGDQPVGACWLNGTGVSMHRLIYSDGTNTWITPGVLPVMSVDRFSAIAEHDKYTMLDAGDPFQGPNSIVTVERGDPLGMGPDYSRGFMVPLGLHVQVTVDEPVDIYSVGYSNGAAGDNNGAGAFAFGWLRPNRQFAKFGTAGVYDAYFDDVPWGCWFQARELHSFRYAYSGHDGRVGQYTINLPMNNAYPFHYDQDCPLPGNENAKPTNDHSFSLDFSKLPIFDNIKHFLDNDPVEAFSGALVQQVTDFEVGGLTPSLHLYRTYRSDIADGQALGVDDVVAATRLFGIGWASDLDQALRLPVAGDDPGTMQARSADGGQYTWRKDTSGVWHAGLLKVLTLTQIGGGWKIADEDGAGTRYDATGRLVAMFDAQGRELRLFYDGSGHLATITDPANRSGAVTTNATGQITRIDLPGGRHLDYTYAAGILRTATDMAGTTITYATDVRGRITQISDSAAHVLLTNVYDSNGRVDSQTDANGHTSHWSYDLTAHVTQIVGARGDVETDCFTAFGAPLGQMDPIGAIRTWGYNAQGDPVQATDPLGNVSTAVYDDEHHITSATDPIGRTVSVTWEAHGQPAVITGADGVATTGFDPATHLPLVVTRSDATHSLAVAKYTYDPATKLVVTTTDANLGVTRFHYDAFGYVDSIIDPMNRKTTFVTDPNTGLLSSSVDPLGNAAGGVPGDHRTTYTYDDMGRVLTVTDALGNMAGGTPVAHQTTYVYDSMGRLRTASRASGALTTYNYDLVGQLISTVENLTASVSATTTYEYNPKGQVTAVTDPESHRTSVTYDLAGWPVSTTDAAHKVTTFEHDLKGHVTKVTDPTNVVTTAVYDAVDRVSSTTDGASKATTYAYDPLTGALASVTDPLTHRTTYGYDWLGRLTSVTNAKQQMASVVLDNVGNTRSSTNARNKTTSFTYNLDNQLLTVSEPGTPGTFVTTYTYDVGGRLHTRRNARSATDTVDYDSLGRPTVFTDAGGKIWRTFYTNDGQVDHTVDANLRTTQFGYDLAGRLVSVTPTAPTAAISYSFDKADRLVTMVDGNGTTTRTGTTASGRVTSVARGGRTTAYTYDDAGRAKSGRLSGLARDRHVRL